MKKNLELTYDKEKLLPSTEVKLNKKNYITILIPIILVIILILGIAFYVFVITSPYNKLKKHLEEIEYICNNKTCTKEVKNTYYTINYKEFSMYVETPKYRLTISDSTPSLEVKNTETVCTYTKGDYSLFTLVDNTFIYEKKCEDYIKDINKYIGEYKEIVKQSGIDVNKINK